MKISALVKLLFSILFLLIIPTSCEKEKPVIVKRNDNTAEVKRLTIIGDNYLDNSDYQKAFPIFKEILSLADPVKDRIDYVDAMIAIAIIQQYEGNYLESETTATKVLPYLKYLKKPRFAWEIYRLFTVNYLTTKDYDNALIYAKKAYNLNTSERRKANALANIALVYMHQENHKKAIKIYIQLTTSGYYAEKKKANTLKTYELMDYAVLRNNIGICYATFGDSKAVNYYKEALKIRLKTNDKQKLPDSYSLLSDYYLKSNPSLAKKYAKKAYESACIINTYSQKKYALETLIRTSSGNELKKYTDTYIELTNNFNETRLAQKNQFANIQYNFRKDKEENLELKTQKAENELELQRQKNRSSISFIIICLSVIALFFLAFYITSKAKKEKKDAVFKSEIRLSEKLHSEITKDIYETLFFSKNYELENKENKEKFLSNLNNIYFKTRKISRENSVILTDDNYVEGLKEMISGYTTPNFNIIINGLNSFSWSEIDRIKKITVFRVLQEIFDAIKNINDASLASITFKKESKNMIITYVDNSKETENKHLILEKRLQNVENRIQTLKGTLNFDKNSQSSFKISFTFPI